MTKPLCDMADDEIEDALEEWERTQLDNPYYEFEPTPNDKEYYSWVKIKGDYSNFPKIGEGVCIRFKEPLQYFLIPK